MSFSRETPNSLSLEREPPAEMQAHGGRMLLVNGVADDDVDAQKKTPSGIGISSDFHQASSLWFTPSMSARIWSSPMISTVVSLTPDGFIADVHSAHRLVVALH